MRLTFYEITVEDERGEWHYVPTLKEARQIARENAEGAYLDIEINRVVTGGLAPQRARRALAWRPTVDGRVRPCRDRESAVSRFLRVRAGPRTYDIEVRRDAGGFVSGYRVRDDGERRTPRAWIMTESPYTRAQAARQWFDGYLQGVQNAYDKIFAVTLTTTW